MCIYVKASMWHMQAFQAAPHNEAVYSAAQATDPKLSKAANPLASVAGLFGFQSGEDEGDTAGPSAIQGLTRYAALLALGAV